MNARRPFPFQSTMFYSTYDGRGWYDSLQVKLNKRFSHGLQFLASYTWAKSMDDSSIGPVTWMGGWGSLLKSVGDYHARGARNLSGPSKVSMLKAFRSVSTQLGTVALPEAVHCGKPPPSRAANVQ